MCRLKYCCRCCNNECPPVRNCRCSDQSNEKTAIKKSCWTEIARETNARVDLLEDITKKINSIKGTANAFQIAATEVFVEKAQNALTKRGTLLLIAGSICVVLTCGTLGGTAWFIESKLPLVDYLKLVNEISITAAVLHLIKATTAGGLAIGLAVYLGKHVSCLLA